MVSKEMSPARPLSVTEIHVDVRRREIRIDDVTYELIVQGRRWLTVNPKTGEALWFRPVPRHDGAHWWFVGEPHDARLLCSLWCGACEREGVDPRPAQRGSSSGTYKRR